LDICCGTGSIGIALSDYFDYVYGVEMVESAIEDAKINVRLNNLEEKCDFILGKAEDKVIEICEAASQVISPQFFPTKIGFHIIFT
jgi:tRNA/tmRNA/rRNA uracil-C5-methylase (TrmA/RlmC/RlmD family)